MNETLKGVAHIGAELAAAKADLQREMERHRKTWRHLDSLRDVAREALAVIERLRPEGNGIGTIVRLKAALSQQAEPLEPAPAQDERVSFDDVHGTVTIFGATYAQDLLKDLGLALPVGGMFRLVNRDNGVLTVEHIRPAQTEQQATVKECLTVQPIAYAVFAANGNVACFSTQRDHPSLVALEADGHSVVSLVKRGDA